MSVLFADLADFTTVAETMDPEEVRRIQSRYFDVARAVVASFEGTIEKFIGDAVMAVWGAPRAHEDDAQRAVRAALALVYQVDRMGGTGSRHALRARAAVTTGEAAVTLGAVGQGMVSGDFVNVAARLQARAPVGGVLVDETTRERAASAATYQQAGTLALKGRTGRLPAYRAAAIAPGAIGGQGGAHSGPFVGREREMRELTDLLRAVMREGRSRLVSVTGIAGIGKSRLVSELGRWVDDLDDQVAWHEGHAPAYGHGIAFAAVAEMVRRRIRIPDAAPPELALRQLAEALEEFVDDDAERRWIEPRLAALLTLGEASAFDRDELFAAWRRFFERVSERMPVVMAFEDLQWADASLIAFIEHIATWSRHRPILILALARPEFADRNPEFGAEISSFTAIRLERLADPAMRELLAQRAAALPRAVLRRVLDQAGGVPLYAVEVARILEQRRDPVDGESTAPIDAGPIDVPDSLHGLIAARIDGLPQPERRLLLAAAALGHRFRPDALLAVVGGDPAVTRTRIDALVRRELLSLDEELNSPGRGELAFVQDLVREVAYQTLALAERRALHLAAARHFESRGEDLAEPLAGHLVEAHRLSADARERGRLARRAVAALRHAARRASLLHAPERALELLERALELSEGAERRAPLLDETGEAARAAGRLDLAERHLRELATIQDATRQRRAAARTRARLAGVLLYASRNEPALAELEAAMRSVRSWQKDEAGVEVAAQLARAHLLVGQDRSALDWADRALAAARRLELGVPAIDLLVTRGTARLSCGEEDAGIADLRDALTDAQEAGALHAELRARNNLAWFLLGDDPRAAMELGREGFDLATTMGVGDAAIPLADIAFTAAVETGAWSWALEAIAELRERPVSDTYRVVFATTSAIIRALRGEAAPMDEVEALGPLPADFDAQAMAGVQHAEAWSCLLQGRFEDARRLAEASIAGYAGSEPAYQRAMSTRASLWLGDLASASESLARLDATSRPGRATEATSMTLRAGIAALRGDPDAVVAYARASEAWQTLDLPLQLALCMLDRHRLLGDGGGEVALLLDGLGANGATGLVRVPAEGVLSRAADRRRPARSRRPSAGTAPPTDGARPMQPGKHPRSRPG